MELRVVVIALGLAFSAAVALLIWAASTGALDCKADEHSEIVSYVTTTTGKPPVTTTTPLYACVKN